MIELVLVMIIGIFLIYIAWKTSEKSCPAPTIEYRFIPRTLNEEMETPVKVSDIFNNMFNEPSPFLGRTIGDKYTKKNEINNNFISQT